MSSERFPDDLQLLAEQFLASGWTELRVKTGDTEILFSLDPNSGFKLSRQPLAGLSEVRLRRAGGT